MFKYEPKRGDPPTKTTFVVLAVLFGTQAFADNYVRGYVKKDGTYVQPHMKSSPNQFKFDNYSSSGNTNPYTGQKGYDRNELTSPPDFNEPYKPYKSIFDTDK